MAKAVAGLLLAGDVDNDHRLDLVAAGDPLSIWQLDEEGGLTDASERFIGREIPVSAADLIDFDSDGDLDLAIAVADGGPDLLRNVSAGEVFEGPLAALGRQSLPPTEPRSYHHLQATDADRDGDTDLLLAHDDGVLWLDNLRQGQFAVHEPPPPAQSLLGRVLGRLRGDEPVAGLETNAPVRVVRTADFDHDGRPEFVLAGARTAILRRDVRGAVSAFPLTAESVALPDDATDVALVDADNDGRRDLAFVADGELRILLQTADSGPEALEFRLARVLGLPRNPMLAVVQAEDLDNDGDLDLAAAGEGGLYRLENLDGSNSNWLRVRLVGLTRGNQKNNVFGRGATIEVRAGRGYQYFEVDRPVTHIGLGSERRPDLLRVVWANGVPQNRLLPGANETIVEEQVLKGSCPFLYAWNGKEMAFVTDLLWGAPLGMPLADGIWNGYDPDELVRVDGAQPRDGFYDLRITEELWEGRVLRSRPALGRRPRRRDGRREQPAHRPRSRPCRPPTGRGGGKRERASRRPGGRWPRPRRDEPCPRSRRGLRGRLRALRVPRPCGPSLDLHLRSRRSARAPDPPVAGRLGVSGGRQPEPGDRGAG